MHTNEKYIQRKMLKKKTKKKRKKKRHKTYGFRKRQKLKGKKMVQRRKLQTYVHVTHGFLVFFLIQCFSFSFVSILERKHFGGYDCQTPLIFHSPILSNRTPIKLIFYFSHFSSTLKSPKLNKLFIVEFEGRWCKRKGWERKDRFPLFNWREID